MVSIGVYVCLVLSISVSYVFGTSNVSKYPLYRYIHLVFLVSVIIVVTDFWYWVETQIIVLVLDLILQ